MMDASVATSGQNGMKASKVKAHVVDLSKQVPDAEVLVKGKRRRFTKQYKLRILKQVDACTRPGQIGAVLRREGLYSSYLTKWRTQRDDTAFFSDFDGDGTIGFGDFVKFAGVFGARHGDEKYDSIYDLNGDGEIGFSDFVIFAQNFGKDTPAPDFTEPQIYNDNIFILPVSEDLTSGYPPLDVYARVFYEHFEDEFDFLIFVRNLVRGTDHVDVNVNHSLLTVKNEVQGIGLPIFSRAHSCGFF